MHTAMEPSLIIPYFTHKIVERIDAPANFVYKYCISSSSLTIFLF